MIYIYICTHTNIHYTGAMDTLDVHIIYIYIYIYIYIFICTHTHIHTATKAISDTRLSHLVIYIYIHTHTLYRHKRRGMLHKCTQSYIHTHLANISPDTASISKEKIIFLQTRDSHMMYANTSQYVHETLQMHSHGETTYIYGFKHTRHLTPSARAFPRIISNAKSHCAFSPAVKACVYVCVCVCVCIYIYIYIYMYMHGIRNGTYVALVSLCLCVGVL
jgi:hypothetical protein